MNNGDYYMNNSINKVEYPSFEEVHHINNNIYSNNNNNYNNNMNNFNNNYNYNKEQNYNNYNQNQNYKENYNNIYNQNQNNNNYNQSQNYNNYNQNQKNSNNYNQNFNRYNPNNNSFNNYDINNNNNYLNDNTKNNNLNINEIYDYNLNQNYNPFNKKNEENLNINYELKKKEENNINNNNSNSFIPQNINSNNYSSELNLIKIMAVLNTSNSKDWKDDVKSFVSSLYYQGYNYSFSKKFEQNSMVFPIFLFNKKIDKIIRDEIKFPLKSFLYMSYRSGFINLSNLGLKNYTSDCGWGCMLRCCQMILSKCLIQKKMFDYFSQKNTLIDNNILNRIRKEVLCLFSDNYLSLELATEHPDLAKFWLKYENIAKINSSYSSISEIIPPYSIHILCKLGNCAGEFTSDVKMIKLICQINSELFNDLNFVHFESGSISRKRLLEAFCQEYTGNNNVDLITYNGVDYQFKKPGVVFISLRLGLYNLDPSYYDFIPFIFSKFRNNYGFVGGKKNRAYYFIGIQGDNKLILVDPHVNQKLTNNIDKDYESYYTENLYLLDIKELSSAFTLALGIFNSKHFTQLLDDIIWFDRHSKFNEIIYFTKEK